ATASLERMQKFDVQSLPRAEQLGDLNFRGAIAPADRIIRLYRQISMSVIEDLPSDVLQNLKGQSDNDFNRLDQILKFSVTSTANPANVRDGLISNLADSYSPAFQALNPIICYATSKSTDFKRMESEARAATQAIKDQAQALMENLATA